jgi:hypothetical protein
MFRASEILFGNSGHPRPRIVRCHEVEDVDDSQRIELCDKRVSIHSLDPRKNFAILS